MISSSTFVANIGVPMLYVVAPVFVLALLPIVVIEALMVARQLKQPFRWCLEASATANAVSTLLGVPFTWGALFGLEIIASEGGRAYGLGTTANKAFAVVVQAPWLGPNESDLHWMVPTAAIVLNVPFFFVSWCSEVGVWHLFRSKIGREGLWKPLLAANIVTYGLLTVFWIVVLVAYRP